MWYDPAFFKLLKFTVQNTPNHIFKQSEEDKH